MSSLERVTLRFRLGRVNKWLAVSSSDLDEFGSATARFIPMLIRLFGMGKGGLKRRANRSSQVALLSWIVRPLNRLDLDLLSGSVNPRFKVLRRFTYEKLACVPD